MTQRSLFGDTTAPAQYDHNPLPPQPLPEEGEARTGEQRKREGMERATWGKERLLGHAREIACDVARGVLPRANGRYNSNGICIADDVAAQFEREGLEWIGNAAGQLFQDGNWTWTGQMVKSSRAHAHQNLLREWKWKQG
jgi:hypothetical protein